MKSIGLGFLCFLLFFVAEAQDLLQCKEKLKRSFAKMNAIYADSSDLYLNVKVTNKNASDKSVVYDNIEMYITKTSFIMKSSMSSYYSDNKNAFMVIPSRKQIYQVDLKPMSKARPDNVVLFVQDMIDSATIKSCETLTTGMLKIVVVFNGSNIIKGQVKSSEYIIDANTNEMKECMLYFNDSYSLIYTSYKFVQVKQHPVLPFSTSAREVFLTEKNTLKSGYAGYAYQDLRQIKN